MREALLASTSLSGMLGLGAAVTHTVSSLPLPLEHIFQDMWRAFSARLYYPALLVALTLPEVCSALKLENDVFVRKKHYTEFVDAFTTPSELGLDGVSCYRVRGGIVHRANAAAHHLLGNTHVIFTVPETQSSMHAFTIAVGDKSAGMFDLRTFCSAMDRAVRTWFQTNKCDPLVAKNINCLISWRPNGLPPFFGGMPVVGSGPP